MTQRSRNFLKVFCARKLLNGFIKMKQMKTSKEQYFYLISGLPDLAVTDTHLPFTAKSFLDDVKNKIHPKDFGVVCTLFYQRDNKNLLQILFDRGDKITLPGCYSLQELKRGIEGNVALPQYMKIFISCFEENKDRYSEAEWEARLIEAYFRQAMKSE